MLKRLAHLWRTALAEPPAVAAEPICTLDTETRGAVADWVRQRRERPATYCWRDSSVMSRLHAEYADRVRMTVAAAERIVRHEFDLLGSGAFVPRDPERRARDGYEPIDWYIDPVRRLRFPTGIPHKKWNLLEMRPGNADVKYPWELGRCQHWAVLGQAYQLTRDDRFAKEIANQLDDFVEANPTGIGVNWTCTMDVGLRAVSWTIGLDLVRQCHALDEAFWGRAFTALFDSGVFIRSNLENTYEVTSNHFLSNLLGLQFVGSVFLDLAQGRHWYEFARAAIEQEMAVQVLPDGADYESSVPYHRLVAELFLGAARLADHLGAPLADAFRGRLRTMIHFLDTVTRPDGLMPQVGDADDGRMHVLGGYASASPQDARHLMGPAAAMFGEPAWAARGGDAGSWEAWWWGLDPVRYSETSDGVRENEFFPQAGLAVARTVAGDFLLVSNGIVGTNGFGNHKHNDQLSFEYHRAGAALVVDPGSFVYTSDPDARNLFRSTSFHNTLSIDGVEQNDMRPDWLFRMFDTSKAESIGFEDRVDMVEYTGRHHGYERLSEPVTHERAFRFSKASGDLEIVDRLTGQGHHTVRWHFHLAPGVAVQGAASGEVTLVNKGRRWVFRAPSELAFASQSVSYSPSYGVKVPCLAIDASLNVVLDGQRTWTFTISSFPEIDDGR